MASKQEPPKLNSVWKYTFSHSPKWCIFKIISEKVTNPFPTANFSGYKIEVIETMGDWNIEYINEDHWINPVKCPTLDSLVLLNTEINKTTIELKNRLDLINE